MFPCLFCFPKSHINKNGGKFVAVSCKKSKKYCCVLLPFLDLRGGCPCAAPISAKYKQNQRQQNQFAKTKIKTGDPQCANIISLCPSITCKLCLSNGSRLSSSQDPFCLGAKTTICFEPWEFGCCRNMPQRSTKHDCNLHDENSRLILCGR